MVRLQRSQELEQGGAIFVAEVGAVKMAGDFVEAFGAKHRLEGFDAPFVQKLRTIAHAV